MSEKMIEIRGKQVSEDTIVEALKGHCDFDKPDIITVTVEEARTEGKKSLLAAVEVSIKKWREIYEASDAELGRHDKFIMWGSRCGLCQRFLDDFGSTSSCHDCLLADDIKESCCSEWRNCRDSWEDWPVFRPAVLKMIERLEKKREKLLKPKPYVFQAGDVVVDTYNEIRIIVDNHGTLESFWLNGVWREKGQEQFVRANYRKIGRLSDFTKRP